MRITERQLRRIIRESLAVMMLETSENEKAIKSITNNNDVKTLWNARAVLTKIKPSTVDVEKAENGLDALLKSTPDEESETTDKKRSSKDVGKDSFFSQAARKLGIKQ